MPTNLSGNLDCVFSWDYRDLLDFSNTVNSNSFSFIQSLTNGTGEGKAQLVYARVHSIPANGTLTINLQSFTDFFGQTKSFSKVREVYIENRYVANSGSSSLTIGGGPDPWLGFFLSTAELVIGRKAVFVIGRWDAAGMAVTATSKNLRIVNQDTTNAATVRVGLRGE